MFNATVTTATSYDISWRASHRVATPVRHLGRKARRMFAALEREERSKLELRLRREEANRKARSDAKSRQRPAPVRGAPPEERNLQTYDDAMAARKAARRTA